MNVKSIIEMKKIPEGVSNPFGDKKHRTFAL